MTTVLTQDQANEILARTVADEYDANPNDPSLQGPITFEGKTMTRQEAAAIIDARVVAARSASTDPQDLIESALPLGQIRLRLRTNLLWSAAYRVIGAARDVMFRMNEHARETGTIDGWNEFYAQLSEAESASAYADDMGYSSFGSGMGKIRAMLSLYSHWRDLALDDARALRVRKPESLIPEIYALVHEAPVLDLTEIDKANAMVEALSKGQTEDMVKKTKDMLLSKIREDHKSRVEQSKNMAPHLERILTTAAVDVENVAFSDLPNDSQAVLLEAVLRSTERLPEQLIKMRSVTTVDMITALPLIEGLKNELNEKLDDPRYAV